MDEKRLPLEAGPLKRSLAFGESSSARAPLGGNWIATGQSPVETSRGEAELRGRTETRTESLPPVEESSRGGRLRKPLVINLRPDTAHPAKSAEPRRPRDPVSGIDYDLHLIANTAKIRPDDIKLLEEQILDGSLRSEGGGEERGNAFEEALRRRDTAADARPPAGGGNYHEDTRYEQSYAPQTIPQPSRDELGERQHSRQELPEKMARDINNIVISDSEGGGYLPPDYRYDDRTKEYRSSEKDPRMEADHYYPHSDAPQGADHSHHDDRTRQTIHIEPREDYGGQSADLAAAAVSSGGAGSSGGSAGGGSGSPDGAEAPILTMAQLRLRKQRLMLRSARLSKKGYPPAAELHMSMRLEEMTETVNLQLEERSLDNSISLMRDVLMAVCTGCEFLNERYDPFDLHLKGWSEQMFENLDSYDIVFEELYYKYNEKVAVEPEIKLLGLFLGSMLTYHFSNTVFNNAKEAVPGFEAVMQSNPQLAHEYRMAALNLSRGGAGMGEPPMASPPMAQPPPPVNTRPPSQFQAQAQAQAQTPPNTPVTRSPARPTVEQMQQHVQTQMSERSRRPREGETVDIMGFKMPVGEGPLGNILKNPSIGRLFERMSQPVTDLDGDPEQAEAEPNPDVRHPVFAKKNAERLARLQKSKPVSSEGEGERTVHRIGQQRYPKVFRQVNKVGENEDTRDKKRVGSEQVRNGRSSAEQTRVKIADPDGLLGGVRT